MATRTKVHAHYDGSTCKLIDKGEEKRRLELGQIWMVNKVKKKFLPTDYQVSLLRKMQNLRQRGMSVKEYTKEFYRLDIRSGHVDDDVEKIARYLNGLRSRIQDEISFVKLESVEEAYQYALKAKELLTKKHEQRQRGRGGRFHRGRGRSYRESGRSHNSMQDKGEFEWKNEDKGKTKLKDGNSY